MEKQSLITLYTVDRKWPPDDNGSLGSKSALIACQDEQLTELGGKGNPGLSSSP